jgi:hypothetical protein
MLLASTLLKSNVSMRVPYPNRAQWLIIWAAFLLIVWVLLPWLFTSDGLTVLRERLSAQNGYRVAQRVVALILTGAMLLLWQASRWTLKFRRPSLRTIIVAAAVLALVAVGALLLRDHESPRAVTFDLKDLAEPTPATPSR